MRLRRLERSQRGLRRVLPELRARGRDQVGVTEPTPRGAGVLAEPLFPLLLVILGWRAAAGAGVGPRPAPLLLGRELVFFLVVLVDEP